MQTIKLTQDSLQHYFSSANITIRDFMSSAKNNNIIYFANSTNNLYKKN